MGTTTLKSKVQNMRIRVRLLVFLIKWDILDVLVGSLSLKP